MPNTNNKKKDKLIRRLIELAGNDGCIGASTIYESADKYQIEKAEQKNIFSELAAAGIEIVFDDEPYTEESYSSFNDELYCDDRSSFSADPVQIYIKEIHRYPTLSHEETLELSKRIASGDMAAREQLINCNLKFAFSVAAKYIRTGIPLLDLIQQANLGLMKATDLYDYRKGARFTTYSVFLIRHSILRYVNEQSQPIRLPERVYADIAKIKNATEKYHLEFMRYPTDNEIADKTGFTVAHIRRMKNLNFDCISTEEKPDREMDGTILDILVSDEKPYDRLLVKEYRKQIMKLLSKLNDRERTILLLRYGLDGEGAKTLDDVGKKLGLTRERVRQIEARALNKIRNMPDVSGLYDFLH